MEIVLAAFVWWIPFWVWWLGIKSSVFRVGGGRTSTLTFVVWELIFLLIIWWRLLLPVQFIYFPLITIVFVFCWVRTIMWKVFYLFHLVNRSMNRTTVKLSDKLAWIRVIQRQKIGSISFIISFYLFAPRIMWFLEIRPYFSPFFIFL